MKFPTIPNPFRTNNSVKDCYEVFEDERLTAICAVRVKKGKYKDLVYFYGKVQLLPEEDTLRLKFETFVLDNPRKHDTNTQRFKMFSGDVLVDIMNSNQGEYTEEFFNGKS